MTETLKHPKKVYIAFCPTFSLHSQFIILHNYFLLNRWQSSPSFISSSASQYINGGGRIFKVVFICNFPYFLSGDGADTGNLKDFIADCTYSFKGGIKVFCSLAEIS